MSDDVDIRPEDALQVAQRALAKANDNEGGIADLQEELTAVQLRVSEFDESRSYGSMTLDDKIGAVREHAYRKALDNDGRTKLYYDDIQWEVFDGEPGSKHCYKLLRRAAGEDEESQRDIKKGTPGFVFRTTGQKHLAVNADLAQQGAAFFPENKASRDRGVVE